ncbi:hypothetical protein [uncultured Pseudokineococcus sp.]|uniref:hypothetical protein n=1 Tax=uncultured Pseudokineococcus sp. TaxID=1642928 RepID=UPI0026266306|nr:hypothetical protein [uncultured Pseudokineococcus sp.]
MPTGRPARPRAGRLRALAPAVLLVTLVGAAGCTDGREPSADPAPSSASAPSASPSTSTAPTGAEATEAGATPSASPSESASPSASPTPAPSEVAVGEVVEGFPLDVVPLLPDAEVALSNVVRDEGGRSVALAGRTSRSPQEVVDFYTQALTAQGFTATTPPAVDGAVVTTYTRGPAAADLLTLSVTSSAGLQDFSIGGRLA